MGEQIDRKCFLIRTTLTAAGASACWPFAAEAYLGGGEGTARILSPEKLVAGEPSTVVVEVTAGPSGIPVGGGVWVGIHHSALWNVERGGISKLQSRDPEATGYVSAKCSMPDNLAFNWYHWAPEGTYRRPAGNPVLPRGDWKGSTPVIFHQCLQAKVQHTPIKAGEKIIVTFGDNELKANAPLSVDKDHEFFVGVDHTGEGVFKGIGNNPAIDLVAAAASCLMASARMTQQVGVPFELCVRAEDKYFNTATSFAGTVSVMAENGELLAKQVKLDGGLARIQIQIDTPGPQRLRLEGVGISGRGEPIMIFESAQTNKIYMGDLHGHTRVSDGCGADAAEYFKFGRDETNLDVCALSDHLHNDWPANQQAVKDFYKPGEYVTILAEEVGFRGSHVIHYYLDPDTPHVTGDFPFTYEENNARIKKDFLDKGIKIITGPHHFVYDRGKKNQKSFPWGSWQPEHARFAEVYSNHGSSEYKDCPRHLHTFIEDKSMQSGLAQGRRFGVIASSDTHVSHPGRSNWGGQWGALAAFIAPALTRNDIWDSLWNRHVYAMTLDRIYIEFKIAGRIMGSDIRTVGPCRIVYEVVGADAGIEVVLVRNNENHRVDKSGDGIVKVDFEETPDPGQSFYYLRVVQGNGEMAWSSPIWIRNDALTECCPFHGENG